MSSFAHVAIQNFFRATPTITTIKERISVFIEYAVSKIKVTGGRLLGR
jgi:hypothetical protein